MEMLILTSNGLSSSALQHEAKKLLQQPCRSLALVPTASNFQPEKEHNIGRHTEIFKQLGLSVDVIDIAKENPAALTNYDVVFLMGGNPFYLLDIMRKTTCDVILSRFAENKTIIGASAGSLVLGPSIELIHQLHPELNASINITDFTGLCLTDLIVYPHTARYISMIDGFLNKIKDYEHRSNYNITCINDGQAVFIKNDDVLTV